ncbi:MAG: hypothetical protein JNK78_01270 [Planctomycetes bacterium]|nr:hypothetical protein [Planctomycetota bacterium]
MNDGFDHVLEFALREVFAEPASRTATLVQTDRAPARRRRLRAWTMLAAAAALVVVVLIDRGDRDATASSELLVAAADGVLHRATVVRSGDTALCPDGPPVQVTLPGGGRLRATAGTAFVLRDDDVSLLAGEVLAETGRRDQRVLTSLGDVAVLADGRVSVRRSPFVLSVAEESPMRLTDVLSRLEQVPSVLCVTVLLGAAELAVGQERTGLKAGQTKVVQDAESARRDAALASTLFVACNRELPQPADEESMAQWKVVDEAVGELARLLLRSPTAVTVLRQDLAAALARTGTSDDLLGRMVLLANLTEVAELHRGVAAVAERQRSALTIDDWVAMAERGESTAIAELRRRLGTDEVLPTDTIAAALVIAGEDDEKARLRKPLGVPIADCLEDTFKFDARCAAAFALSRRGIEAPRRALLTDLAAAIETRLDSPSDLATSAGFVRRAWYFFGDGTTRIGHLNQRLDACRVPGWGDQDDAARVRATMAGLQEQDPRQTAGPRRG